MTTRSSQSSFPCLKATGTSFECIENYSWVFHFFFFPSRPSSQHVTFLNMMQIFECASRFCLSFASLRSLTEFLCMFQSLDTVSIWVPIFIIIFSSLVSTANLISHDIYCGKAYFQTPKKSEGCVYALFSNLCVLQFSTFSIIFTFSATTRL